MKKEDNMDKTSLVSHHLKLLGKIQRNEKINTKLIYIQPDSLTTRLARTFSPKDNNRMDTLVFIQNRNKTPNLK